MALRILLADESSTIKRVMELSLQDYAAEVKSVLDGPDVLEVAKSFSPDIIFTDVLLPKSSGYDVCQQVKQSQLRSIPVILMWSGFMDLDDEKFNACRADGRLEKPFDAETLRAIIKNHVKKASEQRMSDFLTLPKVDDEGSSPLSTAAPATPPERPTPQPSTTPPPPPATAAESEFPSWDSSEDDEEEPWQQSSLSSLNKAGSDINQAAAISLSEHNPAPSDEQTQGGADWNMDSFEDISKYDNESDPVDMDTDKKDGDEFAQVSLHSLKQSDSLERAEEPTASTSSGASSAFDSETWADRDLDEFQLDINDENNEDFFNFDAGISGEEAPSQSRPSGPDDDSLPLKSDTSDLDAKLAQTAGEFDFNEDLWPGRDIAAREDEEEADIPEDASDIVLEHTSSSQSPSWEEPKTSDDGGDAPTSSASVAKSPSALPENELRRLAQEEIRAMLTPVLQELVPQLAKEIIEKELNRLLEENNSDSPSS